jgi:hypothetical protein
MGCAPTKRFDQDSSISSCPPQCSASNPHRLFPTSRIPPSVPSVRRAQGTAPSQGAQFRPPKGALPRRPKKLRRWSGSCTVGLESYTAGLGMLHRPPEVAAPRWPGTAVPYRPGEFDAPSVFGAPPLLELPRRRWEEWTRNHEDRWIWCARGARRGARRSRLVRPRQVGKPRRKVVGK